MSGIARHCSISSRSRTPSHRPQRSGGLPGSDESMAEGHQGVRPEPPMNKWKPLPRERLQTGFHDFSPASVPAAGRSLKAGGEWSDQEPRHRPPGTSDGVPGRYPGLRLDVSPSQVVTQWRV